MHVLPLLRHHLQVPDSCPDEHLHPVHPELISPNVTPPSAAMQKQQVPDEAWHTQSGILHFQKLGVLGAQYNATTCCESGDCLMPKGTCDRTCGRCQSCVPFNETCTAPPPPSGNGTCQARIEVCCASHTYVSGALCSSWPQGGLFFMPRAWIACNASQSELPGHDAVQIRSSRCKRKCSE